MTIHTDSQAALLSLNKHKIENSLTKKAIEELNLLGQTRYIQIRWIKAHVGTHGNEMADNQAKYNANCRMPEEETPISNNNLKPKSMKLSKTCGQKGGQTQVTTDKLRYGCLSLTWQSPSK